MAIKSSRPCLGTSSPRPVRSSFDPRRSSSSQSRPVPFVPILFSTSASPSALTTCWCFTVQVMRYSKYSPAMLNKQFVMLLMHGGVSKNILETIFSVAIVDVKRISSYPLPLRGRRGREDRLQQLNFEDSTIVVLSVLDVRAMFVRRQVDYD